METCLRPQIFTAPACCSDPTMKTPKEICYLRRRGGEMPLRVFRLDLTTGRKTLWREITIADRAGVNVIAHVLLTPDCRKYVLAYRRILSDLFVFTGMK
jgi:hypothetical protein